MKRKYRSVQTILDDALFSAIKEGHVGNAHLKHVIRQTLVENLTETGDITVAYLLDVLCGTELSASKQRLRSQGHIEITKGNEVKPTDELTPDDAEFIDQRRAAHIAGELKTRVQFNHRHGRHQAAAEALHQLSLFTTTGEEVSEYVDDLAMASAIDE